MSARKVFRGTYGGRPAIDVTLSGMAGHVGTTVSLACRVTTRTTSPPAVSGA